MDCFYFKNFFFLIHILYVQKITLESRITTDVSFIWLWWLCPFLQFNCPVTGLQSGTNASLLDEAVSRWLFFFFNCLWTDLRVYKETTLQSHPYWPFVSLVVCVWVQFLSFPFDGYYLPPVFFKKISEHNDLILMQVTLRVWQVIFIARPLAYQAFSPSSILCAQFCLTFLERLRQGISEATMCLLNPF